MQRNSIYVLLLSVAGLVILGMVMLFSTSAFALESRGDMYFFVKRQGMWLGIGTIAAAVIAIVDYRLWTKYWWVLFAGTFILLVLCFVPPIGLRINGSSRWVNLGPFTFQPSELAKLCSIFFLAWWFTRFEKQSANFLQGFIFPLACLGLLVVPIVLEVDLGSSALIFAGTLIEERNARLMAFLDPEKYRLGEGLQQWQALIAFGSGGIEGMGLGEGRQKMLYLPYAHTDFIFPMIGEELGLRFTLLTVLGYLLICICGVQVALNAKERTGMLLGFGCVMMLSLQAVMNIGVTTSLLPNKGMPLPFISFGGSGLLVCLVMVGLLVNIHRHGRPLVQTVSPALKRMRNYCRL
jgi:cell division protein FtsW